MLGGKDQFRIEHAKEVREKKKSVVGTMEQQPRKYILYNIGFFFNMK